MPDINKAQAFRPKPRKSLLSIVPESWKRSVALGGLVVDLFAGGGGASVGLEAALGRPVDLAINHDPVALAAHKKNHPHTVHLETNLREVNPHEAVGDLPIEVLWLSPDCRHHSRAKGGKPVSRKVRSLASVGVRWAKAKRPRFIFLENVEEFRDWGPLDADDMPIKAKKGLYFRRWKRALERLGYAVEFRLLDASQFGVPTKRKRLFLVGRIDGQAIRWPTPTHSSKPDLFTKPLNTAASCIDWTLACPSIFGRNKDLKPKTLWRIAMGIKRFVLENPKPFILKVNHGGLHDRSEDLDAPLSTVVAARRGHAVVVPSLIEIDNGSNSPSPKAPEAPLSTITTEARHAVVVPTLIQSGYGERKGQAPRLLDIDEPLGTVVAAGQKHALVTAFVAKHFGGVVGVPVTDPTGTITTVDHHGLAAATLVKLRGDCNGADINEPLPVATAGGTHLAEVRAFLAVWYGQDQGQAIDGPMRTITTKHRLGLVTVAGVDYQIVDIGLRMLQPHELLKAQFGKYAANYDLSAAKTKAAKVRLIGNSVCPELAEVVVRANYKPAGGRSREVANVHV